MSRTLRRLYPKIEPFASGLLSVGNGHKVYWEACGNPKGKPVVFLHGGPGGGCSESSRRYFNPKKYKIILFDQRGCGRSRPQFKIEHNTTQDLIADMERIRTHLAIEKWLVFGGSWGSFLAIAYAEEHPQRVNGLILRGIFLGRKSEGDWLYKNGASHVFPDYWQDFIAPLSPAERRDIAASYRRRLTSSNPKRQLEAARAWSLWESRILRLYPAKDMPRTLADDRFDLALARLENHYFVHNCFIKENQLLKNAAHLAAIPTLIVQGRYDMVCPVTSAFDLHKALPKSKLVIVPDAGHASNEPGLRDALLRATDSFAKR